MARKFLYVVAILIMLVVAAAFAYRLFGDAILRRVMVPSTEFTPQAATVSSAYRSPDMWIARPDKPGNPSFWTPAGYSPAKSPPAAVFFVHPTSFLNRSAWNAPLDDPEANARAELFLRGQASAFNAAGDIWAPRYRQATFGAFLTDAASAEAALNLAYGDVEAAFDEFLREVGPNRPIILAGHSQGALHLTRLLRDKVAGKPLAKRIVAAYVVGWPISRTADLPELGLPECATPDQVGCILSWESFAEPADPELIFETFDAHPGFNGASRRDTPLVCTNPITGKADDTAPAEANLGTLYPSSDLKSAEIVAGRVPARCAGRGLLLIGEPPDVGPYVLPGNNYHVFDYSLFWANIRKDVERRTQAFIEQ